MPDPVVKKYFTQIDEVIINALNEDIGSGDITTSSVVPEGHVSDAVITAKGDLVLAGIVFAERTFELINTKIRFKRKKKDGSRVRKGAVIAEITGDTKSILMAERVALNLLQRLSGIATLTHTFVKEVKGLSVKIVDTRKTTPGLRFFEKYAVRMGGGYNHRYGLFDGAGGLGSAVKHARSNAGHLFKIEVEVSNAKEVKEALSAGADIIMLDNMSADEMRKSVNMIRAEKPDTIIEASGGIKLGNVRSAALTGVDLISIGAITHSAPAADISLNIIC
jgi:nicotinate-nucleotide pyrophosphorylase (carboxylating)